ncbi:MAG: exosortase A [Woeseia sp.]
MTNGAGMQTPLREYRTVLIACLIMVLVAIVYWQSYSRMIGMWSLSTYQHGWLVYPIGLFILWRKRHALASGRLQGSWTGVSLTGLVVLIWMVVRSVGIQTLEFASATFLIFTSFWAVAGTRAMQKAAFPLGLLLAAVPTGEFLVGYLTEVTADISTALLKLTGVPAYRDGMFLTLPGGNFEVAEMCGGLRYLLAAVLASLAFAYVTYTTFTKRALFVATAALVMVVANGVRAFIVMYVASATDMRVFAGQDHIIFGMFLFAAVFIALILIGERYADAVPVTEGHGTTVWGERQDGFPVAPAIVALLLIVAGPVFLYAKAQQPVPAAAATELPELPGCRGPASWDRNWSPDYRGSDYLLRASYACGDYPTGVYVAGYLHQRQGKELISATNRIWPYEWRRYVDETVVSFESNSGPVDVRQVFVHAPDRWLLIWYWYQVGDLVTISGLEVKRLNTIHALTLRSIETSVVAISISGPRETTMLTLRDELEAKVRTVMSWHRNRSSDQ